MNNPVGKPSSNVRKHTNPNPLQGYLIDAFHNAVIGVLPDDIRSLLEVGCGEGFALRAILEGSRPDRSTGLDIEAGALQWARDLNPRSALVCGDALTLPYADRSFDVVVCLEVLEHLERPDLALDELLRVSQGGLVLSVPSEPWFRLANFLRGKNLKWLGNDPGHIQHWSPNAFRRFVQSRCDVLCWRVSWPWTIVRCDARHSY